MTFKHRPEVGEENEPGRWVGRETQQSTKVLSVKKPPMLREQQGGSSHTFLPWLLLDRTRLVFLLPLSTFLLSGLC